jgi:signal transduction histidine kinase
MPIEEDLSRLTRFEAIFELSSEINMSNEIDQVGELLARRLKYVADVFSWRYFAVESESLHSSNSEKNIIIIDGYRGQATVTYTLLENLSKVESMLWVERKVSFLADEDLSNAKEYLTEQFQKKDIKQLFVCPHFNGVEIRGLFIFSKRNEPFNELDIKFLTLAAHFFHEKVHMLWEQKKLRDLEKAYLQQEIMMRQNEKLATLGRLSAGIAHEINNPASAALRGAEHLNTNLFDLENNQYELGKMNLTHLQLEKLKTLNKKIYKKSKQPAELNPLMRSDLENELELWFENKGINNSWELTSTLVNIGFSKDELSELADNFSGEQFPIIVASLGSNFTAHNLTEEIKQGTGRITQIVKALKSYTYLDQAPIQSVDVHEGLDNTLVIHRSQIKKGIRVVREYAKDIPRIQAYGSELNQVWTNIMDNAIVAMKGNGKIAIKTYKQDEWIVVELKDSGPGIPSEIQSKIFDPFFTTKPPGQGTGMGLNISHNIIVQKHKGEIKVKSKPGETCFQIKLPITLTEKQKS